ncbi:glycosyltransferase family 4 protein [Arthrobacter sp. IA7]|uniref:glycosyltransferase family 4 protein n=1 Tax=Arthrobacter ipis TaxID=2716202 RepID=UPI001684AE3B|nr:glycosyltransferase family 4 protein [Arthrobacter ipis]MBD1541860.1 glycosyltransferase family 4 protein [Arthrobacter ipis]
MDNERTRQTDSLRVLWLTNLAAPYRVPVWEWLAGQHDLHVGLLESNKSLLRDRKSNRGRDWIHGEARGVAYHEVPTVKWRRGEAKYYFLAGIRPITSLKKYDAVVFGGWESPAYWVLLVFARLFNIKCIAFYESTQETMQFQNGPVAWIRSKFFRSMHALVTPGSAATAALISIGVSRSKVHEGFNAVHVDSFRRAALAASAKADAAPICGHRFLYVGQLIYRKRVDAIIDAFMDVAQSEDSLTIIGAGPLENELSQKALSLAGHILLLPQVPYSDLPAIMADHDSLVLASSTEVWGLVVNEALAAGMHAVVTTNCGVAHSVASMKGVFLAGPDLEDLAEQMRRSRDSWQGKIPQPEILQYTPSHFAQVFNRALLA